MGVPVKKDVNLQSEISSDMKRNRGLIWLLASLCALFLTVLADNQEHHVACMQAVEHRTAASNVWKPQQEHSHEATFTDATQLYRICSTRPLRIIPTVGSRALRSITSVGGAAKQYIDKPLNRFYDSRTLITSPLRLSASCDDYVIALRHIIR